MSLLFDANLSRQLPKRLADLFPGAEQVHGIGLDEEDDLVIWRYANDHRLTIVTYDRDYVDLSHRLKPPPKVILVTTGNLSAAASENLLRSHADDVVAFLRDETAAILRLPS